MLFIPSTVSPSSINSIVPTVLTLFALVTNPIGLDASPERDAPLRFAPTVLPDPDKKLVWGASGSTENNSSDTYKIKLILFSHILQVENIWDSCNSEYFSIIRGTIKIVDET